MRAHFVHFLTGIYFLLLPVIAGAYWAPPDTVYKAVKVNQSLEYCVDTSFMTGPVVSLTDYCSNASGDTVNFVLLNTTCLLYEGIQLGSEKACLSYCDDTGLCDTTILMVTVVDDTVLLLPPIAVDDVAQTPAKEPVDIPVLENDILPNNGYYRSLKIIGSPLRGDAVFDAGGVLHYVPDSSFCGGMDSVYYEVCNLVDCDTALATIEVADCVTFDGLYIYNGFTPNGDGINDHWKILGLEQYPNHHIMVFNRWGNKIFDRVHYQNDWAGEWNAKRLPSGTYFYIIDDGAGKKYTGYLELRH